MRTRVFTDSEGNQHGIHDVDYDVASGNYTLPGQSEPLTATNAPTSWQEKFASDQDDFVAGRSVDGTDDETKYITTQQSEGRPTGVGSDNPPAAALPSTSKYATGANVPPLIQQRFDEALENNAMVQAQHQPTKLTDPDGAPNEDDQDDPEEVKLSEPLSPYNAQYPYNQVQETESGHVFELDDSPGAERVNITHRSGTFIEMHTDGKRVDKTLNDAHDYVTGDRVTRTEGDAFQIYDKSVTIKTKEGTVTFQLEKGGVNITLNEGNFNLHLVGGNLNMKVDGNINEEITGNVVRKVGGNFTQIVTGDITEEVTGSVTRTVTGSSTENVTGDITVTGATINLN
jgi:hypothetical protein